MKFAASLLIAAMSGVCVCAEAAEPAKNILFYGNSFTNSSNVPFLFGKVAVAAGQTKPNIENAAVNSQTLYYHRTTATQTALISNPVDFTEAPGFQWDYVVMQEYSTKPTTITKNWPVLGNIDGFVEDSKLLFGLVRDHSPNVTPVMYETWARHPNNVGFYVGCYGYPSGLSSNVEGAARMQRELRTSYERAQNEITAEPGNAALLARVGDAFEASNWDPSIWYTDLYHQSSKGALLAAMVLYETMYNDKLSDLSYAAMNSHITLSSYGVNNADDWSAMTTLSDSVVPEPSSLGVVVTGVVALLRRHRTS